ncbi:actin-like ATPase domain-containing protein [Ascobolus immersus RN42]|uniref:Phosphotransferase n=1 Tax=Ascobolus immersus RN42 TaxID=1160509 RepID=A0A3N4IFZ8_ASCIM|nr:actin-like ATPase domain-containing protein [Ascobolus immersus RN42]
MFLAATTSTPSMIKLEYSPTPNPRLATPTINMDTVTLPIPALVPLTKAFSKTYHDLARHSPSQFLATPISSLPTGLESGSFLALDLGGSNLRVGIVKLLGKEWDESKGDKVTIEAIKAWVVPEEKKKGDVEELYDWVADCMQDLLVESWKGDMVKPIEVGLTWSFPMIQKGHTDAHIMPSGKGFALGLRNPETNIAVLLSQAFERVKASSKRSVPPISILAVTNDSISTILSTAYLCHNPHLGQSGTDAENITPQRVVAGIIAGTGTNATTMCPVNKIHPDKKTKEAAHSGQILLNTEWGINGTLPPIAEMLTKYDVMLDAANEKPGFQPFEELMSGRYLGELVRLMAKDILEDAYLTSHKILNTPYAFLTKYASEIEATETDVELREYLNGVFQPKSVQISIRSARLLKSICTAVSTRASAVLAAATIALLAVDNDLDFDSNKKMKAEEFVVSFTGTVLEKYTRFRERCQGHMDNIMKEFGDARAKLVLSTEGGVVGAGVLAGMVKSGTA